MRAFMVLSVLAVASAQRLGYNYQQGVSGTNNLAGSGSGINSVFSSLGNGIGGGSYGQGSYGSGSGLGFGSLGGGLGSGLSYGSSGSYGGGLSGSYGGGSSGSYGGGVSYQPGTNRVVDGGLTKEYYLYSAPAEQAQEGINTKSVTTLVKKNLRVIFIKAPEHTAVHNAALQIAKQASEDRTAIYVLSKEPDVKEIAHQVSEISENVRAKPEVRFIKYRTNEDAANAQRTIQQQYEQLGGTSQSSDEGVAPVLNFASPAAASGHAHGSALGLASEQNSQSILGSLGSSSINYGVKSNEYLPPAVKK